MMKNGRGRIIDRRVVECSVAKTWFDEIARGRKTIEGRIPKPGGKFAAIAPGDVLMISDATGGHPHHKSSPTRVKAVVVDVRTYASFEGYLESEGVRRTLPGIRSVREGVAVYREFYDQALERAHGVIAIEFELVPASHDRLLNDIQKDDDDTKATLVRKTLVELSKYIAKELPIGEICRKLVRMMDRK